MCVFFYLYTKIILSSAKALYVEHSELAASSFFQVSFIWEMKRFVRGQNWNTKMQL